MTKVLERFRVVLNVGTNAGHARDARHVQLVNFSAVMIVFAGVLYAALFMFAGYPVLASLTFMVSLVALAPIALNCRGHRRAALLVTLLIVNLGAGAIVVLVGGAAEVHYYAIPICAIVWLVIPVRRMLLPALLSVLEMTLFLAAELRVPDTGLVPVSELLIDILHVGSILGSFTVLACCLYMFARIAHTAEARLWLLANTDGLTGLANRREFLRRARAERGRAVRHGHVMSVALFDIDHFKAVNDTHGHPVGDQVIRLVADEAVRVLRDHDIVARIGGEEFAVVFPETGREGAVAAANRVREAVAAAFVLVGHERVEVTISAGVAVVENEESDVEASLLRADVALYDSKRAGRDRVTFSEYFGVKDMAAELMQLVA